MKAEAGKWRVRLHSDDIIIAKAVRKFNLLAQAKVDSGMLLDESAVKAGTLPWDGEGAMPQAKTQRRAVIESFLSWKRNIEELKILRKEATALCDHLHRRMEEVARLTAYCDSVSTDLEMVEFNPASMLDPVVSLAAVNEASSVPAVVHSRYQDLCYSRLSCHSKVIFDCKFYDLPWSLVTVSVTD